MIVDAHAHACGDFLLTPRLLETIDSCGVDRVILVPGELNSDKIYSLPPLAQAFPKRNVAAVTNALTKAAISATGAWRHIFEGNGYVQSLVQQNPDRIIQFYWVSVSRPNVLNEMISHYSKWKFKGIKLHQCWETFKVDSELFKRIAEFAENRDLPIFIHLSSKREIVALGNFIENRPGVSFVIGHLIGLEHYISSHISMKNVFFDLSPFPLISDYRIQLAIGHLGAKKLVFGSDTPYGRDTLRDGIARIRSLNISEVEKECILGQNIAELLKLDCA